MTENEMTNRQLEALLEAIKIINETSIGTKEANEKITRIQQTIEKGATAAQQAKR